MSPRVIVAEDRVRRRQLVEIEDLTWCPRVVRDAGTDWLAFMMNTTRAFAGVEPKLRAALNAAGTTTVLDLCSGAGGPWPTLQPALAKSGPIRVVLSDLYPNRDAFDRLHRRSYGAIEFHPTAVDATDVPAEIAGLRTMFNAFHHFPPAHARLILADAVAKRRPIAVFEGASPRAIGLVAMPLQLPALFLLTPLVRPFRWSRIALTYVIPLIPAMILFDGTVSFLRVYREDELRELVASVPGHEGFEWDIGSAGRFGVSHLIGVPKG
jgi:hypothetical protein